jgi:DNA-binding LytR/AlgR family response regulator
MINIVICDDDKSFTANIKKKLKENINFEYNIFSYENYTKEFLSYIKSNKVSTIYILDIDLKNKDTNGLYIARKIRQLRNYSDEIIFFTSYEKYIKYLINSLINPTAYILKSCYDDDNLVNAVNTAYNFIIMRNDSSNNDTGEIAICESKVDYRIKFKEIIYIEKVRGYKYVLIKTKQNYIKNEYKVLYNIGTLMDRLDDRFCWLNRGVIVNKDYIKYVDTKNNVVGLESGDILAGTEDNIEKLSNWIMSKRLVCENE